MENDHLTLLEDLADLKAEFIAISLMEEGLTPEQILFQALGTFKRRTHRDVENTPEQEIGNFVGRVIESNRSGIYDYLPEQLFHLPSARTGNTLKKKIDEIKVQREKERKTRLFFLPLEQEFFFNKVRINQIEQLSNDLSPDSQLFSELRDFWQIPDFVTDQTFIRLLPVLPEMSECRADFARTEVILSNILDVRVGITQGYGENLVTMPGSAIAGMELGVDTLLGGYPDNYLPELQINLDLPTISWLEKCLTDPHYNDLVNWLLGWLLPVECDYKINLSVPEQEAYFHLETENELYSRLGYSSVLMV